MSANSEFLNFIAQNAAMGEDGARKLMEMIENSELTHLKNSVIEYKKIKEEAHKMMDSRQIEIKDIPVMEKAVSTAGIYIQTMIDGSPEHVAQMMMKGCTRGIIDITENLSKYKDADLEIITLGRRLLRFEESQMKNWQSYLSLVVK